MRKVSKSRTEEDVVSSTNGSIANDVEQDADNNAKDTEVQKSDTEADEGGANGDDDGATKPKKSGKKTPKKRKSTKAEKDPDVQKSDAEMSNDNESLDNNEDKDDEDYDDKAPKAKKRQSVTKTPKSKKKSSKKDKNEEYEVEKIVGTKKIKGKVHYLIRWKGYSADSDSWEPERVVSCPDLISKFKEEQKENKKERAPPKKKGKKRGAKSTKSASPAKKVKTNWDSENADEEEEYEVDRVLEVHFKKNGEREFLIHWKGWSSKFDSWEPESHLNCTDLINKFMSKVESAKTVGSRSLRVAPGTTDRFTLQDPTHGRRLSKRRGQKQRVRYDDAE